MKISKINLICFGLIVLLSLNACVSDDKYPVPGEIQNINPPELDGKVVSISAVISNLDPDNANARFTFENTDKYMQGYVISSDEAGNFYQELILQDKSKNPTAGITLAIETSPLYTKYSIGRKLYIKLKGFTVGIANGVYTLGVPDGSYLQPAPGSFETKIVRSPEIDSIIPLSLTIQEFSDAYENLFIQLENVQFTRKGVVENSMTYAAEKMDQYNALRTLKSCTSRAKTILSTSTYSDFKGLPLPKKQGSIEGILSRTFENDAYVLRINSPKAVHFNQSRCQPAVVDCGLANHTGSQILFADNFEQQEPGEAISGGGWINYMEAGSRSWEAFEDNENLPSMGIGASIDAYYSGEPKNIAWLITPEINFDAHSGETLSFKTSNKYPDKSKLKVLFTSDWNGDIDTFGSAEWAEIIAANVISDNAGPQEIMNSGTVDLSCVEGTGHIAFKYIGNEGSNFDGTFQLDEVKIIAE